MTHPIPDAALDDRLAYTGTAGSGKTYNAMGRVERLLDRKARVIIPDPLGVWFGMRLMADGSTPSPWGVVIIGGPHGDLPLNEHAGAVIGEAVAGMAESCILDLSELGTKAAERRFMLAFLTALYRHASGEPVHLIFDEADMWAPERLLDKEGEAAKLLGMMETIVRRGRVKGFIPWLITQRPAVVSKNVLSQADGLVIFKLTSSQDRNAIGAWVEGQADKEQWNKIYGDLAAMARGEAVVWIPSRGVLRTVQFPEKRTYDSSRTPKRGERLTVTDLRPLDLPALRDRMAKVVEEQKANDPRVLKAEITRLKGELARKPAEVRVEAEVDQGAIDNLIDNARLEGKQEGDAEGYARGFNEAARIGREIASYVAHIGAHVAQAKELGDKLHALPVPTPKPTPNYASKYAPVAQRIEPRDSTPKVAGSSPAGRTTIHDGISGPQQRILDALAWLESIGATYGTDRTRVAMLADQSPKNSGFEKNVSTLKTAGLIRYPDSGYLILTDEGRAIANKPTAPLDSQALHQAIRAKISGPQWRIMDALIKVYPGPLSREDAAQRADQSHTSSGFEKNVSTLRGFGFLDYPDRGQLAATSIMFLD